MHAGDTNTTKEKFFLHGFWMGMLLLLIWAVGWVTGRDWLYERHCRYFKIPSKQFDTIHYVGMISTKLLVMLLFLVPYLALKMARGCCCGSGAKGGASLPGGERFPATRGILETNRR